MAKRTIDPESDQSETVETHPEEIQVIYYGPNLPGGMLAQYTVFKCGIPEHIINEYPEIVRAFASVADFASVMIALNDPHSIESANVARIRASFKKGA